MALTIEKLREKRRRYRENKKNARKHIQLNKEINGLDELRKTMHTVSCRSCNCRFEISTYQYVCGGFDTTYECEKCRAYSDSIFW
jgi:hypothetical protein